MNWKYIEWLLERLIWMQAPTNKEFEDFRQTILKEKFDASSLAEPAEVHGDMRAQPETCGGEVPEHDASTISRLRFDATNRVTNPFKLEKEDDRTWPSPTLKPPLDKVEDSQPSKPAPEPAGLKILPQWLRR